MRQAWHPHSPLRIFGFSVLITLLIASVAIFHYGAVIIPVLFALLVIEITFSFENAIINAKVLTAMSRFWQTMFLTIGIFIAIFGMRVVFPIALVAVAANTPWQSVLDMALNDPVAYSHQLEIAYPSIAAFGGSFLLMLALSFLFDTSHKVMWIRPIESFLRRISKPYLPTVVTLMVIGFFAILPRNEHPQTTIVAGFIGLATYLVVHGLAEFFTRIQQKQNKQAGNVIRHGFAAFLTFLYLEVLDASFSLDSVIGAFAITNQVLLIAAGLGIGAVWVRSMTVYIVRKGSLATYRFLEHGAHYTVLLLAITMFIHVPETFAGLAGIAIIASSFIASKRLKSRQH